MLTHNIGEYQYDLYDLKDPNGTIIGKGVILDKSVYAGTNNSIIQYYIDAIRCEHDLGANPKHINDPSINGLLVPYVNEQELIEYLNCTLYDILLGTFLTTYIDSAEGKIPLYFGIKTTAVINGNVVSYSFLKVPVGTNSLSNDTVEFNVNSVYSRSILAFTKLPEELSDALLNDVLETMSITRSITLSTNKEYGPKTYIPKLLPDLLKSSALTRLSDSLIKITGTEIYYLGKEDRIVNSPQLTIFFRGDKVKKNGVTYICIAECTADTQYCSSKDWIRYEE